MTERLHFHFSLSCFGEGNGNPLQCSCLENPRDGGAWWAAIYGVAQSGTRLKWLSIHLDDTTIIFPYCQTLVFLIYVQSGKEFASQCRRHRDTSSIPGSGRSIPSSKKWQPASVFLPGKFHGQRNLVDYRLWGQKCQTQLSTHTQSYQKKGFNIWVTFRNDSDHRCFQNGENFSLRKPLARTKKKFTVSQQRIYSHGYPSWFPTLDKSHFYDFSLLLSGACIGVKDLASSLEKELAYCFERYQLPQSQVLKLFSFPEVLSQIHA